jgi:hypothetical protein
MRAFIQALLLAAALLPLGLRPASAQGPEALFELMAQCRRDAADLCGEVEPGGLRIAACLYSRINDLSPGCYRAMRDGIALRSCGGEVARYCRGIPPGDGRIASCLRDFREDLGPRCFDALASSKVHRRRDDYGWDARAPKFAAPIEPREYSDERYSRRYDERYTRKYQEPAPEGEDGQDGEDGYSIK